MSRTSRGSVLYRIERIIALRATDFPTRSCLRRARAASCEISHHRVAGYVLAERERERRVQLMVELAAQQAALLEKAVEKNTKLLRSAQSSWEKIKP